MLLNQMYNHNWTPPPAHSLLKGGKGGLLKIESLGGGVRDFLLERADKPEKGELV